MNIVLNFYNEFTGNSPLWVVTWFNFMMLIFGLSVPLSFSYKEARVILLGSFLGVAAMIFLYAFFGFTRILGLGHILFWTPTLIYMLTVRGRGTLGKTFLARWVFIAILVMGISLAFDVVDLLRWILGERDSIRL